MGLRSFNNFNSSFIDYLARTGVDASNGISGYYYPTANPASITSFDSNTLVSISTAGQYDLVITSGGTSSVFMWGAGGGYGKVQPGNVASTNAGAGGASQGLVTLLGGNTYKIVVGGGGPSSSNVASPFGGGGNGGAPLYEGGAGGGYTGLFIGTISQAQAILIAGGGGGSSGNDGLAPGAAGGGGGGSSGAAGENGSPPSTGGGGGTQLAGGTGGTNGPGTPGSALAGGTGATRNVNEGGGGGGGGGYYGGGGGGKGGSSGSGGGGGSGYINPVYVANGILYSATGTTAGNSASSYRGTAGNVIVPGAFVMVKL